MSIKRKIRLMTLGSILIAGAYVGCNGVGDVAGGGSTNNDQGTSFLAYGYFASASEDDGVTGYNTFLAADSNSNPDFGGTIGSTPFDGRVTVLYMGLQNRMSSQYIRVTRIDCDYTVPGADPTLNIPSDSFNSASVIAANGEIDPATAGDPPAGQGSTAIVGFSLISPDIYSFLNVNRNLLPQLPFRMIEECRAVGVTQAGDVIVSNPLTFTVFFYDVAECCTGQNNENPGVVGGFQIGAFTGGNPTVFVPNVIGDGSSSSGSTGPTGSTGSTGTSGATSSGGTTTIGAAGTF